MSYVLDNAPTADDYTTAATLEGDGIKRLVVTVANAGVYYQLARPRGLWGRDVPAFPAIFTLERPCDGIRFKSRTKGLPARVTVEAASFADLQDARP